MIVKNIKVETVASPSNKATVAWCSLNASSTIPGENSKLDLTAMLNVENNMNKQFQEWI